MKRNVISGLAALLLACIGSGTALGATGDTPISQITRLYYYEGHSGLLVILSSMADLGGCGNNHWYVLPQTHTHYKEMVALFMAAQAADTPVTLTVSGCHQGYGRITHAMLVK